MAAGLKDVAKLAGVSIKTVSNVINGYPHISPRTRAAVELAIAQLNYRPNIAARQLAGGRSGVIALAVPELQLPYFAELAGFVVQAAAQRSWTVLVDQTNGSAERERELVHSLTRHLIDGLIFSPLALSGEDLANYGHQIPIVLLGERIWDGPADHVAIDSTAAAREATIHLCRLGRRRIAAIGTEQGAATDTARQRLAGYRAALREAGRPHEPDLVVDVNSFHRSEGAAAMARLLDRPDPPDAVFCFNDMLALGAIRTLLDRGYAVPDDVAVVGFDDVEDGRFSTPTLTTISPDKPEIARLAVEMLAQRLDSDADRQPPREVRAAHRLIPRESTLGRSGTHRPL